MVVDVDTTTEPPAVALHDPHDCTAFSVRVRGDRGALGRVLEATGLGRMDGEEALIGVDAIRTLAAGRVGDEWEGDFAAMCDYAEGKGWIADEGRSIRAHIEE